MYYGGALVADPNDNGTFWQGGKNIENLDNAVAKTTDGGTTWERYILAVRRDSHYVSTMAIAIAPSNSDIVFAGGYDAVYTGTSTDTMVALYKTTDGGDTWTACTTGGISGAVHGLATKPDDANIVYAGTSDGVFKSTDQGTTWTNTGLSRVRDLIIDPRAPNWIYAGTDSGVYVSFSGGNEWEAMNDGLAYRKTRCLEMVANDYLYAGTWGNSIYRCVPDFDDIWPPQAPNIVDVRKLGNHAVLSWHAVITDTLHNPDSVDYYTIYRNTSPLFIPSSSDSIGVVYAPDTTFTDANALISTQDYYYLITATDKRNRTGTQSNMAYVFHKTMNENPSTTNRNWVALPYYNDYAMVSQLVADLSPSGTPLLKITRLDVTLQQYESYFWLGFMWAGTNFAIVPGQMYEMVTTTDTTLVLVGANEPNGLITLNENPTLTDRNWVSIPYNAVYNTVSDITTEYAPSGVPVSKITRLDDTLQQYESYFWLGFMWAGPDFAIEPGTGYEFVATADTFWNPTEYAGSKRFILHSSSSNLVAQYGTQTVSDRTPAWHMADGVWQLADGQWQMADGEERLTQNASRQMQRAASSVGRDALSVERTASSHVVLCHIDAEQCADIVFTVYRPDMPYDVLTEAMIGSGRVVKDGHAVVWFDVGNFRNAWQPSEEVILIIETYRNNTPHCAAIDFTLDATVDMQQLNRIVLQPLPQPHNTDGTTHWASAENTNVIGYSLYHGTTRINHTIISNNTYDTDQDVSLKPVLRGGFETVYNSQGKQNTRTSPTPTTYALTISPNPFSKLTQISFEVDRRQQSVASLHIYDISGRLVRQYNYPTIQLSNYVVWDGTDDQGRLVPSGVYFVRLVTDEKTMQEKILLVR